MSIENQHWGPHSNDTRVSLFRQLEECRERSRDKNAQIIDAREALAACRAHLAALVAAEDERHRLDALLNEQNPDAAWSAAYDRADDLRIATMEQIRAWLAANPAQDGGRDADGG